MRKSVPKTCRFKYTRKYASLLPKYRQEAFFRQAHEQGTRAHSSVCDPQATAKLWAGSAREGEAPRTAHEMNRYLCLHVLCLLFGGSFYIIFLTEKN